MFPKGQQILVGPIAIGCGKRLGEPIRFIAYVQATHSGEQLCYELEQPREKAVTGGSCFQTAPSLLICRKDCPLTVVEIDVAKSDGKKASKASLVTGAVPGVTRDVVLSTVPLRNEMGTRPFVVALRGPVREELRLPATVSLFASMVIPCFPANQAVYARVHTSDGKAVAMQGSDPFRCRKGSASSKE